MIAILRHGLNLSEPEDLPAKLEAAPWWEFDTTECNLQPVLRDLCIPGATVFDVGANAGALTILISRAVGPKGIVIGFEASRRIVGQTQANVVKAGCTNTQIFHRAVSSRSGEPTPVYFGNLLDDRTRGRGIADHVVYSISLDEFSTRYDLQPHLIKIDVGGEELEVLRGMEHLLSQTRPLFIIHHKPSDHEVRALLASNDYVSLDLNTYDRIEQKSDFESRVGATNLLCAPRETLPASYFPSEPRYYARLDRRWFHTHERPQRFVQCKPLRVGPGRYRLRVDATAEGRDNSAMLEARANGARLSCFQASTAMLMDSYRNLIVDLTIESELAISLILLDGEDPTLNWKGVDVWRLTGFDRP